MPSLPDPPSYDELAAENSILRATNEALRATIVAKTSEIEKMVKPKPSRVLDKNAASPFDRPAYSR